VPIYPESNTSLLPDSILKKTESPADSLSRSLTATRIRKVYVGSIDLPRAKKGDTIVLYYRMAGILQGVVTTLGIVDGVYRQIGMKLTS